MRRAERREHDDGIAVGVARTEVVEVDLVTALEERQRVAEGPVRQECGAGSGEDVHAGHTGRGVLVGDDLDRGGKVGIASDVVAMGVRVMMMTVTGWLVIACTASKIDCPQPASLVSTSTTPFASVTSTAVWPPPPLMT